MIFIIAVPCYAAEKIDQAFTGNVYARYVGTGKCNDIPMSNAKATIETDDGYTITITGIPARTLTLRIVPIPSSEVTAWIKFAECIGEEKTIQNIFDIYFEDSKENRINGDGVTITISGIDADILVYAATVDGTIAELNVTNTNDTIIFTANGSHYYVLAKAIDSNHKKHVVIEKTDGGSVIISNDYIVAGDAVIITPIPDNEKEVDEIIIKDQKENQIPVMDNEDGTYSYVQPDGDVNIKATFKDIDKTETPAIRGDYSIGFKFTLIGLSIVTVDRLIFISRRKRAKNHSKQI